MKKKIQLDKLDIQSFVTTVLTDAQKRGINGGLYTTPEPGSGPCVECDASGLFHAGECCDTSVYCGGSPTSLFDDCPA